MLLWFIVINWIRTLANHFFVAKCQFHWPSLKTFWNYSTSPILAILTWFFPFQKKKEGFAWIYMCISVNDFTWPKMDSHKFALIHLKLGIYAYMECVLRTIYMPNTSASPVAAYIFTAPTCKSYYNWFWALCIKCWFSAFHSHI